MLRPEDIAELRWVTITRVSTSGQADGPSLTRQDEQVVGLKNQHDGDLVHSIQTEESATTLDREYIEKILQMAEEDEFGILGLPMLDRLTRADPWEAIDLMRKLYENDIIICTNYYGPYDWDDLQDFRKLANDIAFSRELVGKIHDGQKRGYSGRLAKREWHSIIPHELASKLTRKMVIDSIS